MKNLLLGIFIFAIMLNIASTVDNNTHHLLVGRGTPRFVFPRSDESCPKTGDNQISGYFFDGQKCEVCQNNCTCTTYLGCDVCDSGYGKAFVAYKTSQSSPVCVKCAGTYSTDCCFQHVDITSINTSQYQLHHYKHFQFKAERTTACIDHIESSSTKVFLAGSICHWKKHCTEYTDYGICRSCTDGYYLDSDNSCQRCGHGYQQSATSHCKRCNGPYDCQECEEQFYIPTLYYTYLERSNSNNMINRLKGNASICESCDQHCICSNETDRCTSCIEGYYFNNGKCSTCSTSQGCKTCTFTEGNGTVTCNSCYDGYVLNTQTNRCEVCTAHCDFEGCALGDTPSGSTNVAVCSQEKFCHNGYVLDKFTMKCVSCDMNSSNYARCRIIGANDGAAALTVSDIEPTQCRQNEYNGNGNNVSADHWGRVRQRLPIESIDYFLMTVDNKKTCRQNTKFCKTMEIDSDGSMRCSTCYEDFGYQKLSDGTCINCAQTIQFCNKYEIRNGKCHCSSCLSGRETGLNYHIVSDGNCGPCDVGCTACTTDGTCTGCQDRYYLQSGKCNLCSAVSTITGCIQCNNDPAICTGCANGYRLWNSKTTGQNPRCERCDPYCLKCDNDVKKCTSCMANYYLLENRCIAFVNNCDYHDSDGSCIYCRHGYRLVNGACFQCNTAEQGFFNCPVGCSTHEKYARDGDKLTKDYVDKQMQQRYGSDDATIIKFIGLSVLVLLSALI